MSMNQMPMQMPNEPNWNGRPNMGMSGWNGGNVPNTGMNPNLMPSNFPNQPPMNYIQQMPIPQPQIPQIIGLPGRMVQSEQDIRPNQIPMDGSVSWFPQADGNCVYAKRWMSDGTIQTVKYVPYITPDPILQTTTQDSGLSHLEERLDRIEALLSAKKTNTRVNKEVSSNE